ncbi:MAG: hypothetical protein AVDCRST_MAG76-2744, partial [uncultured Acidimicrobiales bacterium]
VHAPGRSRWTGSAAAAHGLLRRGPRGRPERGPPTRRRAGHRDGSGAAGRPGHRHGRRCLLGRARPGGAQLHRLDRDRRVPRRRPPSREPGAVVQPARPRPDGAEGPSPDGGRPASVRRLVRGTDRL